MECDGMNEDMVNQDGKHQWYLMMQSMSKPNEEKTIMLKALAPWKLMIAYVWCMMFGDVLNLFLLHIHNHNRDKDMDIVDGMEGHLM